MTGLTSINKMNTDIIFTINGNNNPLLEFKNNGEVYYNHDGDVKKVENDEEILEAFKYCILGYTGKEPSEALFDIYLSKIDKGEITNNQLRKIEKRIRKIKLNRIL